MSKFIDKLDKVSKPVSTPLGFHSSKSETGNSSLLLIAGIFSADIKKVKPLNGIPVDAVLVLNKNIGLNKTKQFAKILKDIPLGIIISQSGEINHANSETAGLDFIAFDKYVSMTNIGKALASKLLILDNSFNLDLIRAVNELDIDGVIIDNSQTELLTVDHLLICQRTHELLHKPLLMVLRPCVTGAELFRLREAGITGVISSKMWSIESLIELRKEIDNLPERQALRGSKVDAILPSSVRYEDYSEDDDDSDDEE